MHSCYWEEHLITVRQVLAKFAEADLTVNLAKSEIDHAQVTHVKGTIQPSNKRPLP